MDYKTFDLRRVHFEQLADLAYYNQIIAQITAIKVDNGAKFKEAQSKHTELLRLATEIWTHGSKEGNYIRNTKIPPPPTFKSEFRKLERERKNALRLQQNKAHYQNHKQRSKEAHQNLLDAGFVEWTDFSPWRTITDRKRLMELDGSKWVRKPIPDGEIA